MVWVCGSVRSLRSSHRLFSLHRWAQKNARKVHVKMMRRSMAPPPRSWGLGRRSGVSGQNSLRVWPHSVLLWPCVCVCVSPDVLTVMVGPRLCSQASTHAAAKGASTNKTTLRLRKWGRPTMGRRQRSNTRVSTRSLPSTHLPLQPCCGQRAHRRGFPLLAHLHRTREEARERFVHRRRRCLI